MHICGDNSVVDPTPTLTYPWSGGQHIDSYTGTYDGMTGGGGGRHVGVYWPTPTCSVNWTLQTLSQ